MPSAKQNIEQVFYLQLPYDDKLGHWETPNRTVHSVDMAVEFCYGDGSSEVWCWQQRKLQFGDQPVDWFVLDHFSLDELAENVFSELSRWDVSDTEFWKTIIHATIGSVTLFPFIQKDGLESQEALQSIKVITETGTFFYLCVGQYLFDREKVAVGLDELVVVWDEEQAKNNSIGEYRISSV